MPFILGFNRQEAILQKGQIRRVVGGDHLENPSGKEYAEWDFDLYKDILPGASSQRK